MPKTAKPKQTKRLTLTAKCELEAAAKDKPARLPRLLLHAYTGELLTSQPGYRFPVIVEFAGVEFDKEVTPIIYEHETTSRVAHTSRQWVDQEGIHAEGILSSTSSIARELQADLANGFPLQCSIGAIVLQTRVEKNQDGLLIVNGKPVNHVGPVVVASKVRIKELSVVVLGDDSKTSIKLAASKSGNQNQTRKDETMPSNIADNIEAYGKIAAKYANNKNITSFTHPNGQTIQGDANTAHELAVEEGWEVNQLALSLMRASRPKLSQLRVLPSAQVAGLDKDTLTAAFVMKSVPHSILEKDKHFTPETLEAAHYLSRRTLLDYCEAALMLEGKDPRGMRNRQSMIVAAFSTNTMQEALAGGVDKLLGIHFTAKKQSWRAFATIRSLDNFRPHKEIDSDFVGSLERVPDTGQVKHGYIKDGSVTLQVDQFAMLIGVDRKAIVDDDLHLFDQSLKLLADSANRSLNDHVWERIMRNLIGGNPFFDVANGNLIDDPLSMQGIQKAVQRIRSARNAVGDDLELDPAVLAVPPELEQEAKALLASTELARDNTSDGRLPTGNPLQSLNLDLVIESRLSNFQKFANASDENWYLFAGPPESAGAVFVSFLGGEQKPQVESFDQQPDRLGVLFRVVFDYGCQLGHPFAAVASFPAGYEGSEGSGD